jgi:hypothetical protein
MPRPCPTIEKARAEELTTGEVEAALRELHGLTPAGRKPQAIIGMETLTAYPCGVTFPGTLYQYRGATIEDALCKAYDETVRLLAEIDP